MHEKNAFETNLLLKITIEFTNCFIVNYLFVIFVVVLSFRGKSNTYNYSEEYLQGNRRIIELFLRDKKCYMI